MLSRFLLSRFVARTEAVTDDRVRILQRPLVLKGTTNALGDWLMAFLTPEGGLLSQDPGAYASFRPRTLLIWGALDTTTPLEQGKRLAAVIPNAQLSVLDGVGHMPQIEDSARFNEILLAFLATGSTVGR
jgi:pimeloyl-ACP methyl ester carboxylesterase